MNYAYLRNPPRLLHRLAGVLGSSAERVACRKTERCFLDRLHQLPAGALRPLFLVVGGFMDSVRGHAYAICRNCPPDVAHRCDLFYRHYPEHGDIQELLRLYHRKGLPVILIGHSWGADAAVHAVILKRSLPVDLLITLDPVSRKRPLSGHYPFIRHWTNIYVDYNQATWFNITNLIARIGGPWGTVAVAQENIPCPAEIPHSSAEAMFRTFALPRVRALLDHSMSLRVRR
ncbi:MAG TPA: alpha/beta hydrolase [Candidatus Avidesulfovibrio excrementigallinarum]|nr:alpha/beta hydrolase [Candidatus Avidesulfovibrio excrementigallinarum]